MSEPQTKILRRPPPIFIDKDRLQRSIDAEVAAAIAKQEAHEKELSQKPWFEKSVQFIEKYGAAYDELFQLAETTRRQVSELGHDSVAKLCGGAILLSGVSGLNTLLTDAYEGTRPPYDRRLQVLPDGEFVSCLEDGYEEEHDIKTHIFEIRDSDLQDIRPMLDEVYTIFKTIRETAGDASDYGRTFIHCYAGHNRSASAAAVAVMALTECNLRDAVRQIVSVRPMVLYNYSFLRQLVMWAVDRGMF